ncbi:MAG: hypothetical protein ACLR6W_00050 [Evtepia sp.]
MSVNYSDLAITSLETITAFDVTTGAFMWVLDELQSATISHSEDTTDITGKQGRLLNTLKRNKAVTVSGNNGLISGGLLATQVGSEFEEKTTTVMWPDYIVVTGNSATTTYKAVGTAGNEIGTVYVHNDDGSLGKSFTQNATADATGNFAYAPETKELTFFEGDIEDGTEIVVYYKRQIQGQVVENHSDVHGKKASLYIDAFAEDRCNNVYRIQFYIPTADFNGTFDVEMGENQAVHAFEARSLAGTCGKGGVLWTYTVFGEDTPDEP